VCVGHSNQSYDIQALSPEHAGFIVEVKWDKRAAETGNLYFEIENTRQHQPSGIAATPADVWCHVIGQSDAALLVRTSRMRALLTMQTFRQVHTRGADSNSRGVLVPRRWLEAQSGIVWIELPTVEAFFGELFRGATETS